MNLVTRIFWLELERRQIRLAWAVFRTRVTEAAAFRLAHVRRSAVRSLGLTFRNALGRVVGAGVLEGRFTGRG